MKIALTLQYHPPTGECAYFPTTDNLKMGLALTDDAELLRLLGKVAKRIDELAKSQVVFDFDARPPAHVRDRLFAEAFKEASQ